MAEIFNSVAINIPPISTVVVIILAGMLLLASGLASASEITFSSPSPPDSSDIDEYNHPADEKISALLGDPERFLATILTINDFVNVTIIMLCNFFFMNVFMSHLPLVEFIILTVILAFPLSLFGEIIPKIYPAQEALAFCRFSAPGICFLEKLFHPVVSMLVRSTILLSRHFAKKNHNIPMDELPHALELAGKAEISEKNNILEGITRFGGETVREVMISCFDMVDLGVRTPSRKVTQCITENVYPRTPIYPGPRDSIKGVLYTKDLLSHINKGNNLRWQPLVCPVYFMLEAKMIDDLSRGFQMNKIYIVIAVDEFGGTSGLVTVEDIIEEIVGEIHDKYDGEECTYVVLSDRTWIFETKTQLTDFCKTAKADEDEFEKVVGDAGTLAGILFEVEGEFPALHEKVTYHNYKSEVPEMDSRRILKVKFTILPKEMNGSENKE